MPPSISQWVSRRALRLLRCFLLVVILLVPRQPDLVFVGLDDGRRVLLNRGRILAVGITGLLALRIL
jgi:hypothetical protein